MVKGRRRTFDVDSAPSAAERERLEGGAEAQGGERWVDEGPVRRAAGDAVRRAGGTNAARNSNTRRRADRATKRAESVLDLDRKALTNRLGSRDRAERTLKRLGDAAAAYSEDRYEDARKLLKPIAQQLAGEATVRELHGLCLYRLGRWKEAVVELTAFAEASGSTEQHPVLADCERALGHHQRVEELWSELAEQSPSAALVAEGRIVYAGSLADRGDVLAGIAVLEAGALGSRQLKEHQLRMRYVLGDLYDRVGERQAARRYFRSVFDHDPGFFDVAERLT